MRFLYYCITYLWLSIFESLVLFPICEFFDSTIITLFLSITVVLINIYIVGVYYYEDI